MVQNPYGKTLENAASLRQALFGGKLLLGETEGIATLSKGKMSRMSKVADLSKDDIEAIVSLAGAG